MQDPDDLVQVLLIHRQLGHSMLTGDVHGLGNWVGSVDSDDFSARNAYLANEQLAKIDHRGEHLLFWPVDHSFHLWPGDDLFQLFDRNDC